MTKVINIKYYKGDYTPIHRGTKWGNPFIIGKDGSRDEVIEKYKKWLNESNLNVMELDGKILGCFCKPKKCHGDIIIEKIKEIKFSLIW